MAVLGTTSSHLYRLPNQRPRRRNGHRPTLNEKVLRIQPMDSGVG